MLKDFKNLTKKKFSDISERFKTDRGYIEFKNSKLNKLFKNPIEEEFKDNGNELLISDNSADSISCDDHTPESQNINPR